MNILFFSSCISNNPANVSDYQLDMLFHGLKSLDINVYEYPQMNWMYALNNQEYISKIWGKGFTLYNRLNPKTQTTTMYNENHEFDLIIYGLHHTSYNHLNYHESNLSLLKSKFPKTKIAIIDGYDLTSVHNSLLKYGIYFKRELSNSIEGVLPIQFSFPEQMIQEIKNKTIDFASLVPVNGIWNSEHSKSYIYNDEQSYYDAYSESRFAYTTKKGGWDCLRHYEILMCNSLPYFLDIEKCPENTLFKYPKELCKKIKQMPGVYPGIQDYNPSQSYDCRSVGLRENRGYIGSDFSESLYQECLAEMIDWRKTLTTKSIAQYLLERTI